MVKRSREDFETLPPDSDNPGDIEAGTKLVDNPSKVTDQPSTSPKIVLLDSESRIVQSASGMICALPPHRESLSFATYEDYEVHYLQTHTNRCAECWKNFPAEHFLNLHIQENHDSVISVRRERGEKTASLVLLKLSPFLDGY